MVRLTKGIDTPDPRDVEFALCCERPKEVEVTLNLRLTLKGKCGQIGVEKLLIRERFSDASLVLRILDLETDVVLALEVLQRGSVSTVGQPGEVDGSEIAGCWQVFHHEQQHSHFPA